MWSSVSREVRPLSEGLIMEEVFPQGDRPFLPPQGDPDKPPATAGIPRSEAAAALLPLDPARVRNGGEGSCSCSHASTSEETMTTYLFKPSETECSFCDRSGGGMVSDEGDDAMKVISAINRITNLENSVVLKPEVQADSCTDTYEFQNRNNVSINEFRDTIGICEVRFTGVSDEPYDIIQVNYDNLNTKKYEDLLDCKDVPGKHIDSRNSKESNRSFVSLNTEIMEILTDLDSVLDMSLIGESGGMPSSAEDCSPSSSSHGAAALDLREEEPVSIEAITLQDVKQNLTDVKRELTDIKEDLTGLRFELTTTDNDDDQYDVEVSESGIDLVSLYSSGDSNESASVSSENTTSSIETASAEVVEVEDPLREEDNREYTFQTTDKFTPTVVTEPSICELGYLEHQRTDDASSVRQGGRRASMRRLRPLEGASAPPVSAPPSPELSLSAQLFLESHEPGRYGGLRPHSAGDAPRARGRRSTPTRRCGSLHVSPRGPSVAPSPVRSSNGPEAPTHPQHHSDTSADAESAEGGWSARGGEALTVLSCCLGPQGLCRFALLTLHFGANFVLQWTLLSLLLGAPLLALGAALGAALRAGPLGAWRVAPLLRGLGGALLLALALTACSSSLPLAWLLVYFRDSFVPAHGRYRWAESTTSNVTTSPLSVLIPRYWSEVVLQDTTEEGDGASLGPLHFQLAFHLVLVWAAICLILSKGLRSYGKVVLVVTILPVLGMMAVCVRLLCLEPGILGASLPRTSWPDFFINSQSWSAAAQETFLTWGLLMPTVWALSAAPRAALGAPLPRRPMLLPALIVTPVALMVAALIGAACRYIIQQHGYQYSSTSYEFLSAEAVSVRHLWHHSSQLGVRVGADGNSGAQPLRLATQLLPAALALLSTRRVSSFWAVLFYLSLLLLGLAQLAAVMYALLLGVIDARPRSLKSRRTTLVLILCCTGLLLALPLACEGGLQVARLLDYATAGGWWQGLLQAATLLAVFLVRGRPYAGETVAIALLGPGAALGPLLSFTWNVVLPVAIITLCVVDWRVGRYRQLYGGSAPDSPWGPTLRHAGGAVQLLPLLLVPVFAVVQTYRYLSQGPPDILERIQLLYRPRLDSEGQVLRPTPTPPPTPPTPPPPPPAAPPAPPPDPPPKYTPPPSYSTATGARLAKMLRNSIRRSIRRVQRRLTMGEGNSGSLQEPLTVSAGCEAQPPQYSPRVEAHTNRGFSSSPQLELFRIVSDKGGDMPGSFSRRMYRSFHGNGRKTITEGQPPAPVTAAAVAQLLRSGTLPLPARPPRHVQVTLEMDDTSSVI